MANISDKELRRFKEDAKTMLSFSEKDIEILIKSKYLQEV
jgi:hypothetical protein